MNPGFWHHRNGQHGRRNKPFGTNSGEFLHDQDNQSHYTALFHSDPILFYPWNQSYWVMAFAKDLRKQLINWRGKTVRVVGYIM